MLFGKESLLWYQRDGHCSEIHFEDDENRDELGVATIATSSKVRIWREFEMKSRKKMGKGGHEGHWRCTCMDYHHFCKERNSHQKWKKHLPLENDIVLIEWSSTSDDLMIHKKWSIKIILWKYLWLHYLIHGLDTSTLSHRSIQKPLIHKDKCRMHLISLSMLIGLCCYPRATSSQSANGWYNL